MATRTIAKPNQSTVDPLQVATDLRAIVSELSLSYYERAEILVGMVLCILSGQHGYLLGKPGSGKSEMCLAISRRFQGKFWHILLDRQMGKEEMFGAVDIARYDKEGVWEPDISDSLADCEFAFLDEIGKASPSLLNSMLTALNERRFKRGKSWIETPLMTAFAASNEMLEAESQALFDRFPWRREVPYIVEDANMAAFFQSKVLRPNAARPTTETYVNLSDLQYVVQEVVPAVFLPPSMVDTLLQLKSKLMAMHGIEASTRRWGQAVRFMQASAFFEGRDTVDDDDIIVLSDILWTAQEDIPHVKERVMESTSEITKTAKAIRDRLDSISTRIDERANDDVRQRADEGADQQLKLAEADRELRDLLEKARRDGRSTTRIEDVQAHLKTVKSKCYVILQNIPEAKARSKAGL